MPCRDYYDDADYASRRASEYKAQRDKLARIACRAMALLEKSGIKLDNKEAQDWYQQHKIDDAKAAKRREEERRREAEETRLKKAALSKLSPAEKKVLGVK